MRRRYNRSNFKRRRFARKRRNYRKARASYRAQRVIGYRM
jgi:hypothetical protein